MDYVVNDLVIEVSINKEEAEERLLSYAKELENEKE